MAKLLASAMFAASVGAAARDVPYMYTVTGACDVQESINGLTFLRQGVTFSGAPWFKAIDSETYLYWDPDCMGSGDGTPRWIIDNDKPDVTRAADLDNDHFCDYIARINSDDISQPPVQGSWTLNCGGTWQQNYLILLQGTTTQGLRTTTQAAPPQGSGTVAQTTATRRPIAPHLKDVANKSLTLDGACASKNFLNGLVFEEVGMTADGRPFYKAETAVHAAQYIYFDSDCDGQGGAKAAARWIIGGSSRPSTVALQDLDQDGKCDYHARVDSSTHLPPAFATWRMYCGAAAGGWRDVHISLREATVATTSPPALVGMSRRGAAPLLTAVLAAAGAWRLGA